MKEITYTTSKNTNESLKGYSDNTNLKNMERFKSRKK